VNLAARIQAATANSLPFLVSTQEGDVTVERDCRIYGEGSPWWGPGRIDVLTVAQCRVVLERLTIGGLWLLQSYLSADRDVVVLEGGLRIGGAPEPTRYPSAITLDGVYVQGGGLRIEAANVCWHGGSVERTTGPLEISSGKDIGSVILTGVRFEHDVRRKLGLRGPSPVILQGCHLTLTDVEIAADAHPDTAVVGCSWVLCGVRDLRPRKSWWRFW